MQQKNIFLMLALSGSVLMMMLVSVLLFVPTPSGLRTDITAAPFGGRSITLAQEDRYYGGREPDEILQTIQSYVANNDPDAAKRLYDELYSARRSSDDSMGGEVAGILR